MWDFVMDESGAGAGFLRELRFPQPIYIPSASPQSSSLSPEAGTKARSDRSSNSLTKPELKKAYEVIFYSDYQNTHSKVLKPISLSSNEEISRLFTTVFIGLYHELNEFSAHLDTRFP
jgi:hypothetical protein